MAEVGKKKPFRAGCWVWHGVAESTWDPETHSKFATENRGSKEPSTLPETNIAPENRPSQ